MKASMVRSHARSLGVLGEYSMHSLTKMRILATYRAHLDGVADSVTFECDGARSSMCANGTLTWSCSEQCPSPSGGCSMELSAVGLRRTLPAALGDVRCAPWITLLCVH